ncbi:NADPH dependent diflavin oxidoreductase-like protein 1 [Neohortaea acidophila]|uniref:NADPH-dependent diflavin oxidoreductase 1 n=1 Tax=Neohortaea acidophila TaxID=245834 RepID=A0A6A6PNX4_9PEZI|nr:NADPH dependent diflavin oxidoreductase-like protein 1 [Neohortaea acidophila]KAF2481712.1 NADPH dependent diflavin oxidoreductase-like protein 1 [Neohortaea acidophila]
MAGTAMSVQRRTALIVYGSETGNAQDVAEEVGRMAERLRFETIVLDMDSVQLKDLLKYTVVIFALSTTGQGEMPQNARIFWKTLLSGALKVGILRKLKFCSFGLGDSSYARFNVAHRMLCNRLQQLGARLFCERGEGNEQHPEGHSAGFREWIVQLRQKLLDAFPLDADLQPLADDVFIEPKWKLAISDAVTASIGQTSNGPRTEPARNEGVAESEDEEATPSGALIPMNGIHTAHIVANDRVTHPRHFQDVRLLDLVLDEAYTYGPGAVAVVYPKNFPKDVDDFIQLMGWQDAADQPLQLISNNDPSSVAVSAPSPLRHLDLAQIDLSLRWLLENVLDIMSIPRRSFFASLAHFAGESTEDEAYQKERLLELANPDLIDELWDYTTRPKRTILEVMMDFTTIKVPWQYALSAFPAMKGRQFSITSGGRLRCAEDGRTKVELLVAIADPPSPIIKWRRRYGVCTRYIASLRAGQSINVGLQQGYLDVQPSELEVPAIMIGPGTGLAPMRSMVWQRLLWAQESNAKEAGRPLAGDILIFGCRAASADYFFRDEWNHMQAAEGLHVLAAFSRDPEEPKRYVQDRMREESRLLQDAILERQGKIYISGSSGNMPKGVREALLDVLSAPEALKTKEGAEQYLDAMERAGRYKQETW